MFHKRLAVRVPLVSSNFGSFEPDVGSQILVGIEFDSRILVPPAIYSTQERFSSLHPNTFAV